MGRLEIEGLTVTYGKATALRDIDVSVEAGSVTGVIGPNGAGKTTLLNAISGLKEYDGSIKFDGEEITSFTARERVERGIVHCTEKRDLFPYFTVEENLRMGSQFRADKDAVHDDLEMVYDLFPRLDERRDQHAHTMSGGEQQMLAIGRALMSAPDLLMLDEPTLGLAPTIIEDISEAMETLQAQGMTILLVEQNASFAMAHAEKLSLLETGTIELTDTAESFKQNDRIRDAYIGID